MSQKKNETPKALVFAFGGLSGCGAATVVQPMDLVKNRMQVSGEGGGVKLYNNSIHCAQTIIKTEGFSGLYSGLSASLARQVLYTTTRLGLYNTLLEKYSSNGEKPGFFAKAGMGLTAGATGALIGTPADVALVRMCVDNRLPVNERRNYKSVIDAWSQIIKTEGVTALWTGCGPTIGRAMVVNVCQLCCQTQAKEEIAYYTKMPDGYLLSFFGSMVAGLITTCFSLPVDIAKTRTQNMKVINGVPEYKGMFDVLIKTSRNEGIPALWKGFTPYLARTGPQTVVTLMLMDGFMSKYKSMQRE